MNERISVDHGPQVSVIGTADPSQSTKEKARAVGRHLADRDAVLICGGGGGVMTEACRGHGEVEGGLRIGILKESNHGSHDELDVVIPTGIGHARNLPNVLAGQAVVAVGGRYGTLSEIAFTRIHDRPLFGVATWEHPEFDFPANLSPEEAVTRAVNQAG
jgi:uncharacterized protein (TIGR00725 family)